MKTLTSAWMAVLVLLGFLAGAQAAELLILKSTDPSLPEGGIIDGAQALSLPAGVTLTLVGEEGKKITLEGPYSGVPAASDQPAEGGFGGRMLMALSRLIAGAPPDPTRLGATRGSQVATADDFWLINVSVSGDYCLRTDRATEFWRPQADMTEALSIKRYGTQGWAKSEWPAGDDALGWPSGVDLVDDGTYLVRLGMGISVSKIVVHLLPDDLPSDFHRAAWMTEKGCLRQARALLSSLE
ncbi:MAG: hypothetical protein ACE5JZ_01455 [Kiloniellales bacterium]